MDILARFIAHLSVAIITNIGSVVTSFAPKKAEFGFQHVDQENGGTVELTPQQKAFKELYENAEKKLNVSQATFRLMKRLNLVYNCLAAVLGIFVTGTLNFPEIQSFINSLLDMLNLPISGNIVAILAGIIVTIIPIFRIEHVKKYIDTSYEEAKKSVEKAEKSYEENKKLYRDSLSKESL